MPIRQQPYIRYRPEKDPFSADIYALLEKAGCTENHDLLASIVSRVLLMAQDQTHQLELKIVSSAMRELRQAFRVFKPYRDVPKVSVFGSARTPKDDRSYDIAREFSRLITEAGWMVITGAGGGIMEAGHEGAGADKSFGVAIQLPFEQRSNPVIEADQKLVDFKYFFTRKLMFVKEAKAVCALPGGFGTMDEAFEVLTLIQTGKATPMPVVLLDWKGSAFWTEWEQYVRDHLLARRLISEDDFHLYHVCDTAQDAVDHIRTFYRRYHSSRYAKDLLVVRMSSVLPDGAVDALNAGFKDILTGGVIRTAAAAIPEEGDESPNLRDLPRLVMKFDRRRHGRLRQLIDRINGF